MNTFRDLRILFFGTPDFAVASLKALLEAGCTVVAAVTAPDKPSGRGLHLHPPAVKMFAAQHGIPVLQPPKLKDPEFLKELQALQADLQVVVAFRMLPESVWNMPPMGTINVHASLLPQYRGAAPINWVLINGEQETGVTTFKLQHRIDTGNILLRQKVAIDPSDDAGTLHDKLMAEGASLLLQTIKGLADGSLQEQPQVDPETDTLRHASKIFKEDTRIHWDLPAEKIHNLIRGLSPHPAAFTHLQGKVIKIFHSDFEQIETGKEPGTFDTDGKTKLRFAAMDGWVYIKDLQQEGKKRMLTDAFLRGFRA